MTILRDRGNGFLRAEVGHDISLGCDYQVATIDSLYSIKWYRDDREFFRYIPTGDAEERHTSKGVRRSWQILYYLL